MDWRGELGMIHTLATVRNILSFPSWEHCHTVSLQILIIRPRRYASHMRTKSCPNSDIRMSLDRKIKMNLPCSKMGKQTAWTMRISKLKTMRKMKKSRGKRLTNSIKNDDGAV